MTTKERAAQLRWYESFTAWASSDGPLGAHRSVSRAEAQFLVSVIAAFDAELRHVQRELAVARAHIPAPEATS